MSPLQDLEKRQWYGPTNPTGGDDGFYSNTAEIVKYAVLVAIVLIVLLWVFGGVAHANRRIKQGKPLLAYHRWMWKMSHRGAVPQYTGQSNARPQSANTYHMQNWSQEAPPPPAYNHQDIPPAYQPPPNDKSEFHNVYINAIGDEQGPASQPGEASIARPPPVATPQGLGR